MKHILTQQKIKLKYKTDDINQEIKIVQKITDI
jgi:hypothetical protein